MIKCKFSIITINLNNAEGLLRTIESVVNQPNSSFEYIVIDGGSTDNSLDIIKSFEKNIKYWVSEPDNGIYQAMNKGILKANGDYCLFLNSGDWLIENILYELDLLNITENIFYGNVILMHGNKEKGISRGAGRSSLTFFDFYAGESIKHQASLIKRSMFEKYGLYDESYAIISDWVFFMKTIIFKDVTLRYENINIAYFNIDGIGSKWNEVHLLERKKEFQKILPNKIYTDYEEMIVLKEKLFLAESKLKRFQHRFGFIDRVISHLKRKIVKK